ncbi:CoA transferase [Diaphorobacter sp. HDW4A]|uniref:CaiB/BaiF CoA transferase family protein n=1 Tax=Diaphorobacter sp. HDW4A TaxID=2714924 RepID=UPI00140E84A9|nr:CoA transferase [Diaphorobacter sp. HDW4A]QIL80011.1 CoA transferase [Diaphorobacter sp. HDW4A]
MQAHGPLKGIKVVEIGVAMAGPFCAMLLGDYGADVIKIEKVEGGDDSRTWPPYFHGKLSYYYASTNRNKRCIALDLKQPEAVEIARELIRDADVLVQNYRPGALDRMGLDWESLSKLNPRLVYCAISGFGRKGDMALDPANDLFMQAFSGGMSVTGFPGQSPVKMGISVADIGAGMFAALGVMMALRERDRTERGQRVDTSLLEGQVAMLAHFFTRYFASGIVPGPMGGGALNNPTYQSYQAADGWIVIAAFNDRMWRGLAQAVGAPEWLEVPEYATQDKREVKREEIIRLLAERIAKKNQAHWLEVLSQAGVPCSPVHRLDQVAAHPQVHAAEMIQTLMADQLGEIRMAGLPIKLEQAPGSVRMPPPRLGQHTEEILKQAGRTQADIDALSASRAVKLDTGWN